MKTWAYKIRGYSTTLFSKETYVEFVSTFLQVFGVLALFLGVFDIFFPDTANVGVKGLEYMGLLSIVIAIVQIRPRLYIKREFKIPDTTIKVSVGDLFYEDGHKVIGMNDTFDTEIGEIIKNTSVQGQFLTKIYKDDLNRLNQDLESALDSQISISDKEKTKGKCNRYPIGTIATLGDGTKYFCIAYSRMSNRLNAESDVDQIWASLSNLWEEVSAMSQGLTVNIPVIGSDLARVVGVSHEDLIKIIITSFIISSRKKCVTKNLNIIIYPKNLTKVNLRKIEQFLNEI